MDNFFKKILSIFFICCVSYFIVFPYITILPYDIDESFSLQLSSNNFKTVINKAKIDVSNGPIQPIQLYSWIKIFGDSNVSTRSFSMICYMVSAIFIFLFVEKLIDFKAGIISSMLFLLNPLAFKYAINIRSYILLLTLTCSSLYFYELIYLTKSNQKIKLNSKNQSLIKFLYLINLLLLPLTHFFGAFVIFTELFTTFLIEFKKKSYKNIISIFIFGLTILILFFIIWGKSFLLSFSFDGIKWIKKPTLNIFLHYKEMCFSYIPDKLLIVILILSLIGIIYLLTNKERKNTAYFLILLNIIPFLLAYIKSFFGMSILVNRNFILLIPSSSIALGIGIYFIFEKLTTSFYKCKYILISIYTLIIFLLIVTMYENTINKVLMTTELIPIPLSIEKINK